MNDDSPLKQTWQRITEALKGYGQRVIAVVRASLRRVRQRWNQDTTFRRTLTVAINAVTITAFDAPHLAPVVEALLTERVRRSHIPFGYDEDDEYDTYPRSPRLWDTLN